MNKTCTNCNELIIGSYCHKCGKPVIVKRIDKHYIQHEVLHLFHIEKGFLYTAKQLFFRPGHAVREYLDGERNKHMKPFAFLIFSSLLYTLLDKLLGITQYVVKSSKTQLPADATYLKKLMEWVTNNYGYSNALMGLFVAYFIFKFFKKKQYNFYEIVTLYFF